MSFDSIYPLIWSFFFVSPHIYSVVVDTITYIKNILLIIVVIQIRISRTNLLWNILAYHNNNGKLMIFLIYIIMLDIIMEKLYLKAPLMSGEKT